MQNQLPPNRAPYLFLPQTDAEYRFFLDAPMHPFEPGAGAYSKSNAAWLADAALLAYWNKPAAPTLPPGWQQKCLDGGATQCQITSFEDFTIVAFRGTQPNQFKDVLFDANIAPV